MQIFVKNQHVTEMKLRQHSINLMHGLSGCAVDSRKFLQYFFLAADAYQVFARIHLDYCKAQDEGRVLEK